MRAGVAKICITPPVGTWQGGYGARMHPCVGVHDDLYARAIVFEGDGQDAGSRAAIVSVDVSGLPQEVSDAARRKAEAMTGIPAAQIAFCTSHTHGGPVTRAFLGRDSGPQVDEEYLRILEKYLAGAVAAAARDLRPAAVRVGRGQAGFNVNRRLRTPQGTAMRPNPEGAVDREVVVLRIDTVEDQGRVPAKRAATKDESPPTAPDSSFVLRPSSSATSAPLAVLFRYTCHATAMGAQNYLITGDYPGAAAATIERAYGGQTQAIFLQGCAGNVRPNLTSPEGGFRSAHWDELARLGRELGSAAVAAAEHAAFADSTAEDVVRAAGTITTLPFAAPPPEDELRALASNRTWPGGQALTETERQWANNLLKSLGEGTLEQGVPADVQVFRLGSVWLVTLPGEVFLEIGWKTRDAVAHAAGVPPERVVVAAYTNGSVGYVPSAAAIPEGGYEVTAYRHGMKPLGYAPEAEDALASAAAQLAAALR